MSEFKKGDLVSVTYEGEVKDVGPAYVNVDIGARTRVFLAEDLTLLERPVEPLTVGSVVRRHDDTFVVVDDGTVVRVGRDGRVTPDSAYTATALAEYVADRIEFQLIHDGSKK